MVGAVIRKVSAEQVYHVLLQNGDLVPDHRTEKALEIISETCWEGDAEEAKHQRLELCAVANIETGQLKKSDHGALRKNSRQRAIGTDENASYSSLVGSAGF
ncbi:hypothetical protein RJ640_006763 [Escallonia rubra]|uniref:Uncharacterized protein n=1 Tax=Escallonia rubra TaxID=112253 RepID=A0AA88QG16_9ASTE|nr:hypothetical protein RJ640_006763 [Escallonia rubra]